MTDQHPITPPPELQEEWLGLWPQDALLRAARWGADQELEACCEWLNFYAAAVDAQDLRAARRPKPKPDFKGLVERALAQTNAILNNPNCILPAEVLETLELNRRDLERLKELEGRANG